MRLSCSLLFWMYSNELIAAIKKWPHVHCIIQAFLWLVLLGPHTRWWLGLLFLGISPQGHTQFRRPYRVPFRKFVAKINSSFLILSNAFPAAPFHAFATQLSSLSCMENSKQSRKPASRSLQNTSKVRIETFRTFFSQISDFDRRRNPNVLTVSQRLLLEQYCYCYYWAFGH